MADEQCIFCMISEGKIQAAKVYEDEHCCAFLDINPASKGHMQVISKIHSPIISSLDEASKAKMLNISLNLGQALVSKLGATGISYLMNEGAGAGQRVAHAAIQVIPRYEGDGISISWPEKKMSQEEIQAYVSEVISMLTGNAPAQKSSAPMQSEPKPNPEKPKEVQKDEPEEIAEQKPRIPRYW